MKVSSLNEVNGTFILIFKHSVYWLSQKCVTVAIAGNLADAKDSFVTKV